jgi:hypothetical protein
VEQPEEEQEPEHEASPPPPIIVEDLAQEMRHLDVNDGVRFEQMDKYSDQGSELDGYPLHPEEEYYRQQHMYRQNYRPQTHVQSSFEYVAPPAFRHNKQHTGLKNISSFTLGDDRKIDYDQMSNDGFQTKINRPIAVHKSLAVNEDETSSISSKLEHTHTDQGYLDLKFYHNRLW